MSVINWRSSQLCHWESVKQLQYFGGTLDFKHSYDLQCWHFLSVVGSKFKYLSYFFMTLELQYHKLVLDEVYFISSHGEAAVCEHFRNACDC